MTNEERKEQRKERKRLAREKEAFNLKLARIYGRDKSDLSEQRLQIFRAAASFHQKAFDIADRAETPEAFKSLEALAEHAIIRIFDLKKSRAHESHGIQIPWTAEMRGVVPLSERSS